MNNRFSQWKEWAVSHLDIAVDLVRIYLGIGLFMKGFFFLSQREYLLGLIQQNSGSIAVPAGFVNLVGPLHMIGGAMLALGLFTRIAALIQLPILAGAVFFIYFPMVVTVEGRQNFEFTALVLYLTILFAIFGAGRWSLDHRRKTVAPANTDLCLDMMRIYLGFGLFMKGIFFIEERDHLMQLIVQAGDLSFIPATLVHYIIPVHLVGGVLLMLGLVTRFAAGAQIPILIGAVFYVFLPRFLIVEARQDFEFTALVLFLTLIFTGFGAGRVSIDHKIRNEAKPRPAGIPAHA